MLHGGNPLKGHCLYCLFTSLLVGILLQLPQAASIVAPSSNCYVLDNSSYLFDFTSWIGRPFEYVGKGGAESPDLMIRFCKDVESRSKAGYFDFGRFATSNHFVAGSGNVNFIQGFYKGDLLNCEHSFDKMGRTAQVNLICGNCINGLCKGDLGCICNVTYDEARCRVLVELAIPCEKKGSRVFEGFTVGFHPRSWEIVYNGMTQLGFEKPHTRFSFETEQTSVSLYLTAISSLSRLVGKPFYKVVPENGLEVKFTGSGANGDPPTTLSPTTLVVNWRCVKAHNTPYEVTISIPVKGYEPIKFTLTKMCEYSQDKGSDATRGWATFGVFSCIFIVISTLFCCGGFIYKARVEHQHGLDALPGMTILSACLETVTGPRGYSQIENPDSTFTNQASWEHMPVSAQGTQRTSQRKYGTI